ncbi:MFS transporter [Paenibacillus abyssi]|uniref:MFS-type transporter YwoD n=1 Tax=Paenibacillus abyssi TaxID=1340531 RepID=A0A917CMF0_9BACL|nr:MFS transporter [Paenibacillus abyssi]GGF93422.1 putative MFS-type transporter YwoD [Paenibacillus abyssi]
MVDFRLLLAVAFGILLNPLNSSMIAVALSRLQEEYSLSFADSAWLISTYYLASAIGQPIMGKLSDSLGQKRLFIIGLSLVAAASMLAPLSPSFGWLIAFRIIQAIGSSTLYPAGMSAVRKAITKKQAQAFSFLSIFASTSAALGPSIGGFLIHYGDWPAIFLINFPFIIASFLLALKAFPKDETADKKTSFPDPAGIVLFSSSIISMLLFLLSLDGNVNWWMLAWCSASIAAFCFLENKMKHPFIDVRSLRSNTKAALVYVRFILVNVLFYSLFFGVPSYLQHVHGYESGLTGIVMLSVAGFGVVVSPIAARWIDRTDSSEPAIIAGAVFAITGTLLLLTVNNQSAPISIFLILSLLGCSNGFSSLGLQTALFRSVAPQDTGAASGLFMTSRYLGTILSSCLLGIIFKDQITTEQFHIVAVLGAGISSAVLLLTFFSSSREASLIQTSEFRR